MSSWVWRAVQHAASSLVQDMPEGHSASLQLAGNDRSTMVPLHDKIISAGTSLHLTLRVCWLPQGSPSHDLLFLFQKVKYSGWFFKDWIFFLQECSYHGHQNCSPKQFGEKASHLGEEKTFLHIWSPLCLSWEKRHQTFLMIGFWFTFTIFLNHVRALE